LNKPAARIEMKRQGWNAMDHGSVKVDQTSGDTDLLLVIDYFLLAI
jgi:hypothetical protein